MRCLRMFIVAGLWLAPLLGPAAYGTDLEARDPRTGQAPPPQPAAQAAPAEKGHAGCANHGTTLDFFKTPQKAAEIAKRQEKLVFVLHLSGIFEDPRFT